MASTVVHCLTSSFSCSSSSGRFLSKSRSNLTLQPSLSSSSSSSIRFPSRKPRSRIPIVFSSPHSSQCLHSFAAAPSSSLISSPFLLDTAGKTRLRTMLARVEERELEALDIAEPTEDTDSEDGLASRNLVRLRKLYVCNLPRSYDIPELLSIFKSFGTVLAVEVLRSPDTGISRGSGYVTMGSFEEAKAAIASLDGSDVGGRELRVRFMVEMPKGRSKLEALNSMSKRTLVYESPYKVYVGNLAWSVKPSDLRYLFSGFGTVISATVVQNLEAGRRRNYGFLSFSSASERDAAFSLNGTELCGRNMVVRGVFVQTES